MIHIEEIKSPKAPRLSVVGLNDAGTIKLNTGPSPRTSSNQQKSVNFGPGIEMLMNPKRQSQSPVHSDINLSDLRNLDANLMGTPNLTRKEANKKIFEMPSPFSTWPTTPKRQAAGIKLNINELPPKINLAKSSQDPTKNVTWDGFKTFNEIPVNPDVSVPQKPPMAPDVMLKEKLKYKNNSQISRILKR